MKQASVVDVAHKLRLDRDVILGIDDSRTANCAEKKKKKKSNIDAEKDRGKEDNRDETRGTRREEYHVHIRLL